MYKIFKILYKQPNITYFSTFTIFLLYNYSIIFYNKYTQLTFFIFTPIIWTLQEYFAHYVLLHKVKKFTKMHNIHHKDTNNKNFIFIPIIFTLSFSCINSIPIYILLGKEIMISNYCSNILCYFLFEYTHYYSHINSSNYYINKINNFVLSELKLYHLMHHNKNDNIKNNYGFTSASWDIVFNTINKKYYSKSYWLILSIPYPILPVFFFKILNSYL